MVNHKNNLAVEVSSLNDNAWYEAKIEHKEKFIIVNYIHFENDFECFENETQVLQRIRYPSPQLQDEECYKVKVDQIVSALLEENDNEAKYYDAKVLRSQKCNQPNEGSSKSSAWEFYVKFLHSPVEGLVKVLKGENICLISKKNIKQHPVIKSYLKFCASQKTLVSSNSKTAKSKSKAQPNLKSNAKSKSKSKQQDVREVRETVTSISIRNREENKDGEKGRRFDHRNGGVKDNLLTNTPFMEESLTETDDDDDDGDDDYEGKDYEENHDVDGTGFDLRRERFQNKRARIRDKSYDSLSKGKKMIEEDEHHKEGKFFKLSKTFEHLDPILTKRKNSRGYETEKRNGKKIVEEEEGYEEEDYEERTVRMDMDEKEKIEKDGRVGSLIMQRRRVRSNMLDGLEKEKEKKEREKQEREKKNMLINKNDDNALFMDNKRGKKRGRKRKIVSNKEITDGDGDNNQEKKMDIKRKMFINDNERICYGNCVDDDNNYNDYCNAKYNSHKDHKTYTYQKNDDYNYTNYNLNNKSNNNAGNYNDNENNHNDKERNEHAFANDFKFSNTKCDINGNREDEKIDFIQNLLFLDNLDEFQPPLCDEYVDQSHPLNLINIPLADAILDGLNLNAEKEEGREGKEMKEMIEAKEGDRKEGEKEKKVNRIKDYGDDNVENLRKIMDSVDEENRKGKNLRNIMDDGEKEEDVDECKRENFLNGYGKMLKENFEKMLTHFQNNRGISINNYYYGSVNDDDNNNNSSNIMKITKLKGRKDEKEVKCINHHLDEDLNNINNNNDDRNDNNGMICHHYSNTGIEKAEKLEKIEKTTVILNEETKLEKQKSEFEVSKINFDFEKKKFELEKKSFELEKKSFELEKKNLDLEKMSLGLEKKSFENEKKCYENEKQNLELEKKCFELGNKNFENEKMNLESKKKIWKSKQRSLENDVKNFKNEKRKYDSDKEENAKQLLTIDSKSMMQIQNHLNMLTEIQIQSQSQDQDRVQNQNRNENQNQSQSQSQNRSSFGELVKKGKVLKFENLEVGLDSNDLKDGLLMAGCRGVFSCQVLIPPSDFEPLIGFVQFDDVACTVHACDMLTNDKMITCSSGRPWIPSFTEFDLLQNAFVELARGKNSGPNSEASIFPLRVVDRASCFHEPTCKLRESYFRNCAEKRQLVEAQALREREQVAAAAAVRTNSIAMAKMRNDDEKLLLTER